MKTRFTLASGFCAAALAVLSACNNDSGNPAGPNGSTQTVSGQFQGDPAMAKTSTNVQGAVVVAYAVSNDGSFSQEIGRDTTDAHGNFQIATEKQGAQNWVFVATQGSMQWMSRYNDTLSENDADTVRPVNFESTLQTQVYLALQKTEQGRRVTSGEMTTAVDIDVAASSRSQYENGDSAFRVNMISHFTAAVTAQSQARASYLQHAGSQYASDTAYASAQMQRAEGSLTIALNAANGDSAQTRLA